MTRVETISKRMPVLLAIALVHLASGAIAHWRRAP